MHCLLQQMLKDYILAFPMKQDFKPLTWKGQKDFDT